jgi:hypothetical protein
LAPGKIEKSKHLKKALPFALVGLVVIISVPIGLFLGDSALGKGLWAALAVPIVAGIFVKVENLIRKIMPFKDGGNNTPRPATSITSSFRPGDKVIHSQFGEGIVESCVPNLPAQSNVSFSDGQRRVVSSDRLTKIATSA